MEDGSISDFGNQGCNCPLLESEQVFQLVNNWTKTWGNHSFRFGGDIRYAMNLRDASDFNRAGQLSFGNGATGSGIASVLLGYVDTFQRFDVYSPDAANRQKRGAFYAQDSWRLRPNFTLNYGVRWDIVFPETVNSPGQGGFTDLSTGMIRVAGIDHIGTNGNENIDLTNFGGRIGICMADSWWHRAARRRRANVRRRGIFWHDLRERAHAQYSGLQQRGRNRWQCHGEIQLYLRDMPAAPAPYVIPVNGLIPIPNGVNTEFRPATLILPRIDQFNVSLQQAITHDMTFTLAYVSNVAERIYPGETFGYNVNVPMLPSTPADLANRDARRPYFGRFSNPYNGIVVACCNQDITSTAPAARSNYNAFQATLEQRLSHGVQVSAHYTWSRALNYGQTFFAQRPGLEYGPSDTNRNNVFVLSGLWDLPVGRGRLVDLQNKYVNAIAGGWQLSGTTTWESGLPFTPTYGECGADQDIDNNFASPGTSSDCRPDIGQGTFRTHVGGLDTVNHARSYFTPMAPLSANSAVSGAFARPAFGTIGNVGRNSLRGPSDYFADAAVFKTFSITERMKLQAQFQAFNVFNHVPLGVPGATNARCIDCSGDAGLITGVDSALSGTGLPYMRTLQFGARVQF